MSDGDPKFHGNWDEWDANTAAFHRWRSLRDLETARNDLITEDDEKFFKQIMFIEEQIRQVRQQLGGGSRNA